MKISYIKDTKRFWQERKSARAALDKKRSSQKTREVDRLRSDALFLKSGKIVSTKS